MLTITPILLDGRRLLCTTTYSALTRLFVLVSYVFGYVVSTSMYISALLDALRTLSEFSSVPILVADELAHSSSCETPILGNYPTPKHLSLEQLSHSCDLAIRVAATRNIRTRFPKNTRTPWTPISPPVKVAKPRRNTS